MKAIVLAAGYATRLYPLTRDRAKPLLDVGGRSILDHILDCVLATGDVSEVIVVSNAKFADAFAAWRDASTRAVPLRVLVDGSTCQDDRLGASGDLAFALRECPPGDDGVLVVAGDNLIDLDLAPAVARFRETGCPTLVLREVERDGGPSRYNEVETDADGNVTRFHEKPEAPRSRLAAIALYLYPPTIAGDLERYLAGGGNPDAPGHFVAWLVERTRVVAVPLRGRWFDIGDRDTLAAARARFGGRGAG